ncbi:sn-glycerol-3-phosphate ABC transporter ATP-binding protein UgpC [Thorsellia kenyensis]|uniref:sn-glycerol-3-phosphate ABC transporter ATP-binding protein UgpC n=1 Tax=Thorsellia kenyensis TaxID=1549888 RepID=UPI00406CE594
MSFLSLKKITKSYDGTKQIIQPLDVEIEDGEFIVIVGPSGCGKSTLLRMVAGLEQTTSGEIWIDGKNVTQDEPKDRQIAMVFQNYALYPHMSVFDNIAYGLKIRGELKSEIEKKVKEVAGILSLEELLTRKPKELSGGQRQRVAMGRAIVRKPSVFLFDEPLSNLDAKLRVQMRLELKALQGRLGVTSLYVTHDQVEAMTLADRVIIMNAGIAEQIGTPEDLYHNPQSTFVASFIGSPAMNLLNIQLYPDINKIFLINECDDSEQEDAEILVKNLQIQRREKICKLILGVRPEHFKILNHEGLTPPTDAKNINNEIKAIDENSFRQDKDCVSDKNKKDMIIFKECIVELVEHLGADNLIYSKIAGQTILIRAAHDIKPTIGDKISLSIAKNNCYCFDPISGKRIDTIF